MHSLIWAIACTPLSTANAWMMLATHHCKTKTAPFCKAICVNTDSMFAMIVCIRSMPFCNCTRDLHLMRNTSGLSPYI